MINLNLFNLKKGEIIVLKLLKTIASTRQGSIEVRYHEPLLVSNFAKRKELAAAAEKIVRSAHIFAVSNLKNQASD